MILRWTGLVVLAVATGGCADAAAAPGDEPRPLMSGTIVKCETDNGYGPLVGGKSCDLFADYARIAEDKDVLWIPREHISFLRLQAK
jgi:hypothetical protein